MLSCSVRSICICFPLCPDESAAGRELAAVAGPSPALCQPRTGLRNWGPPFPNCSAPVPPRIPASRFIGHHPHLVPVPREHPAASRTCRCWVVPGRDSSASASSVRRVPSFHSKVSLRLGYPWPLFLQGLRVSALRKCQAAFEQRGCSAASTLAGSVSQTLPGSQGAAVPAAGAESVGHLPRWGPFMIATHCAGAPASRAWPSASIRRAVPVREHRHHPLHRRTALTGWAVPAQALKAVFPTLRLPVLVGVWEPEVSQTLRRPSPSSPPHQTAFKADAPLRCAPYGISGLSDAGRAAPLRIRVSAPAPERPSTP